MLSRRSTSLLMLCTTVLVSCGATGGTPQSVPIEKPETNWVTKKLATLPAADDTYDNRILFSADGNQVAYIETTNDRDRMVVNDKAGRYYDRIPWRNYQYANWDAFNDHPTPVFSPTGQIVYQICEGPDLDERCYEGEQPPIRSGIEDNRTVSRTQKVVIGDVEGDVYASISAVSVATDGTVSYMAVPKGIAGIFARPVTVRNGKEEPTESTDGPAVSPDGKTVVHTERTGDKTVVVINGKKDASYDNVSHPFFTPDSSTIGYFATRFPDLFLVMNGKEWKVPFRYPGTGGDQPVFSTDGKTLAFTGNGKVKGSYAFSLETETLRFYPEDGDTYHAVLSPDGSRLAYVVTNPRKENTISRFFSINGQRDPQQYRSVEHIAFSPDGKRVAYNVRSQNDAMQMIIDGSPQEAYEYVGEPVFSPDSRSLAYNAREADSSFGNTQMFLILDGKKSPTYRSVGSPVFSADGSHMAYTAGRGIKEMPRYDENGRHFVTDMINAEELVLIDGKETQSYDTVFGEPVFSPDGTKVAYGARKGNELFWVVDTVKETGSISE